jgi:tRNA pseudouridine38-40 synthase
MAAAVLGLVDWSQLIATLVVDASRTGRLPSRVVRPQGPTIVLCASLEEQTSLRHRARLMYDGECFSGMQTISNGKSVADVLETALEKRMGTFIRILAAGRTDAGVHARGQAVHFDLPTRGAGGRSLPLPHELEYSLNCLLPPSVRIHDVELAPEADQIGRRWHARYWSTGKLYSYRLGSGGIASPLERRQRHWVGRKPLDVAAMAAAAQHLHGAIDCAAFANRRAGDVPPIESDTAFTTRLIRRIDIVDEGEGRLRLDFHVQSALYKMVRNMVGLLVDIGQKRCAPEAVPTLIAARDRGKLPAPAPAHGLTLESVYYHVGWGGRFDHELHEAGRTGLVAAANHQMI